MEVSTEALVDMLREVEADDPIDYADLPFGEQELRRLVMTSLVERHHQVEAGNMSVSDIHALYLLSTAKLVLENTVLHARLLASGAADRCAVSAGAIHAQGQIIGGARKGPNHRANHHLVKRAWFASTKSD